MTGLIFPTGLPYFMTTHLRLLSIIDTGPCKPKYQSRSPVNCMKRNLCNSSGEWKFLIVGACNFSGVYLFVFNTLKGVNPVRPKMFS